MFSFKKKTKEPEGAAFLKFCERNFGGPPDSIHVLPANNRNLPDISTFFWQNCPEPGMMTVVSYGLSSMSKPQWTAGRPELMLRLETTDKNWGLAMAAFIELFREEKSFGYKTILTADEPLVAGTEMRGFFTFAPALAEREEMTFESGEGLPIHLTGFYPIYLEERDLLPRMGLEAFWKHESYDPCSVTRPNLAKIIPGNQAG